jgi:hypothetical protein
MENELLYVSLQNYYKNPEKSKYLLKYLKYEKISLRIIDWFVTNYSKKYDTMYNLYNDSDELSLSGGNIHKQFNVFYSYKSYLKSFSKRNFDPFCRRNRIDFECNGIVLNTTIGQLNFLKWGIDNLVIEYILSNYNIIEDDMNTSIKNIRKNYIKSSQRKQRQELSLSASRGLNRHNGKVIITFD